MTTELKKYDIINILGRARKLVAYLEICTPSTGLTFSEVDGSWFAKRHRLVYRCGAEDDDGQPYTFRTTNTLSSEITEAIHVARDEQPCYDLVFVDPWHSLDASRRDLAGGWKLLRAGGVMVVHDCNPPNADFASPEFRPYGWCGETYRAYIDFLAFRTDADFCTIDTDYGCAVVRKLENNEPPPKYSAELLGLWLRWSGMTDDPAARYRMFDTHRRDLLNLVSAEDFMVTLPSSSN